MKNKNMILLIILAVFMTTISCEKIDALKNDNEPKISQMKVISELAVMKCYYHNVAKFKEEDASGILLWKKDKHFWIEYSGTVKIGIDSSLLNVDVNDTTVTVTIPQAKVLDKEVDALSLNKDSFYVDINSAKVSGEDEIKAFEEAQDRMESAAVNDSALLSSAQQRVKKLLEEYINNIGDAVGNEYTIKWVYLETSE